MNKIFTSFDEAVADIGDGASVMVSGAQGPTGIPRQLLMALRRKAPHNITLITATGYRGKGAAKWYGYPHSDDWIDHGILIDDLLVKKLICSMAFVPGQRTFLQELYESGRIELEHLGHGTFLSRMWAGGAGLGGVYNPVGIGTIQEEGKEKRVINGREYLFEEPLTADFALIRAYKADKLGNLIYKGTARQFGPIMAKASRCTIVEVSEIVEPGEIDPETVITPSVYVHRIIQNTES